MYDDEKNVVSIKLIKYHTAIRTNINIISYY